MAAQLTSNVLRLSEEGTTFLSESRYLLAFF
ncbi:hypothetical protein KIPB_016193, partial [Kipferlia bialata]|eukprot:g16193.t1